MSGTKPYHKLGLSLTALMATLGPEVRRFEEGARMIERGIAKVGKKIFKPKLMWKERKALKKARRKK